MQISSIDFIKSLKNISLASLVQISTAVTGIINVGLILNFYSIQEYGIYTFSFSLNILIYSLTIPGLKEVMFIDVAEKFDASYLRTVKFRFIASLFSTLVFIVIGIFLLNGGDILFFSLIGLIIVFPFSNSVSLSASFVFCKKKFNLAISLQIVKQFSITIGYITLIIFQQAIFILIFYHAFLLLFIDSIVFLYSLTLIENNNGKANLFRRGFNYSIISSLEIFESYFDRVISGIFSFSFVALVSLSQLIYSQGRSVALLLANFLLPDYIEKLDDNTPKNQTSPMKTLLQTFFLFCSATVVVLLLIPIFYSKFFNIKDPILHLASQLLVISTPAGIFKEFYKGVAIKRNRMLRIYLINITLIASKLIGLGISGLQNNLIPFSLFSGGAEILIGILCFKELFSDKNSDISN